MSTRRFIPGIVPLDGRTLPSASPVSLVGDTLLIRGASAGHTAAIVTYGAAPDTLEVDYGTETSVDALGNFQFGPLRTSTFQTADVARIVFVGTGDRNLVENDTIVIPETDVVVGDHNSYIGGPEYDQVVMVGSDNSAFGDNNYGDRADRIVLIEHA